MTLLPVLVHHELVFGNVVYYALDHAQLQYPRFAILCSALQEHGELPYWQHLLYGGAPFHANPEIPTLYPPALVLAAFLSPARTMNVFIVFHMAVGALGMHLFVQHLWRARLGRRGGLVAGAVAATCFLLNFYTRLEHIHLVEYGAAHMLLPWILLVTERVLLASRPAMWSAVLALLGGLLVNTGGLYVILFGGLFCALWVVRFGLLGGPAARRRALIWIPPAVVAAGLLALAKLLPYFEWLPVTNRAEPVPIDIASARSLGGREFSWLVLWSEIELRSAVGVGVALFALGAVLLRREPVVRFAVATALVVGIFAAGPAYPLLYHLGAPFTLVRTGPERLWTIDNLLWPVVAGLGVAALIEHVVNWRRRHADGASADKRATPWLLDGAAALVLPLVLLPALLVDRESWAGVLSMLEPVSKSIARYERWPKAAAQAGDDWRVWWIGSEHKVKDGGTPIGDKNEQFFTTHVRVETLAGLLGYLWPVTLEHHLYLGQDGILGEAGRTRRAGMLSARYLISARGPFNEADEFRQLDPRGVEGRSIVENPWARPRVLEPRRIVAVFGDTDMTLAYRLLDDVSTAIDVTFLSFPAGTEPSAEECAQFELVLLVDESHAPAALPQGVPIVRTSAVPLPDVWRAIGEALGDEGELLVAGHLTRDGPNRTNVVLEPSDHDRFVVLSETWSTDSGWHILVDGAPAIARRADGIVSAVLVPRGATTIAAKYAPPSIGRGYFVGVCGLVLVLALAVLGAVQQRRINSSLQ